MARLALKKIFLPVDHLGHKHSNIYNMFKHFRLTSETALWRYKNGWSLEKILTTPDDLFLTKNIEKYITANKNKYTDESARQLNIQVKNVAQLELTAFSRAEDKELYLRQEHQKAIRSSLTGAYFALAHLWIRQKVGDVVKEFPVFYFSSIDGNRSQKSLKINADFVETYGEPKALMEIYLLLIKYGLCLRIQRGEFFLGFKDYSNLTLSKINNRVNTEHWLETG